MKISFPGKVYVAWILALSFVLTSCAGRLDRPRVPAVIAAAPAGNYTAQNYSDDLAEYEKPGADKAAIRNKIVYNIAAEIDYAFYDYEARLFVNEGKFHIGADFLQLGLAAGSTVSMGARGKTILSALLTGVTGLNLSIDKNLFRQQTVQAIASSMEANRDRIKTSILKQLSNDATAYPLAAARADLIHYFFAGTLGSGLQQLSQTAATDAKTQSSALAQAQVATFSKSQAQSALELRQVVSAALAGNDLSKVIVWLRAMGVSITDAASKAEVEKDYRDLGAKILTDTTLRDKYFAEARQAGLIP